MHHKMQRINHSTYTWVCRSCSQLGCRLRAVIHARKALSCPQEHAWSPVLHCHLLAKSWHTGLGGSALARGLGLCWDSHSLFTSKPAPLWAGNWHFKSPYGVALGFLPYSGPARKTGEQRKTWHKGTGVTACIVCKPVCNNIKVFLGMWCVWFGSMTLQVLTAFSNSKLGWDAIVAWEMSSPICLVDSTCYQLTLGQSSVFLY